MMKLEKVKSQGPRKMLIVLALAIPPKQKNEAKEKQLI